MIPYLLIVRPPEMGRKCFLVRKGITVGMSSKDDLIICHPNYLDRGTDNRIDDVHGLMGLIQSGIMKTRLVSLWPILFAIIIVISVSTFSIFMKNKHENVLTQDWTPISLPTNGIYGLCRQDKKHPEGVRFRAPKWTGDDSVLLLTPGGTGNGSSIIISVGGIVIPDEILLPKGWGEPHKISLPSIPESKSEALIEIRPLGDKGISWGVKNIRILKHPARKMPTASKIAPGIPGIVDLESIQKHLNDPMVDGKTLGDCSQALREAQKSATETKRKVLIATLSVKTDKKIKRFLDRELIKLRYLEQSGERLKAELQRDKIRMWLPSTWKSGQHSIYGVMDE